MTRDLTWLKSVLGLLFPSAWLLLAQPVEGQSSILLEFLILLGSSWLRRWPQSEGGVLRLLGRAGFLVVAFLVVNWAVLYPFPLYEHWREGALEALRTGPLGLLAPATSAILGQLFVGRGIALLPFLCSQALIQGLWAVGLGFSYWTLVPGGVGLLFLILRHGILTNQLTWKGRGIRLGAILFLGLLSLPLAIPAALQVPGEPPTAHWQLFPGFRDWARRTFPEWRIPPLFGTGGYGYSSGEVDHLAEEGNQPLFSLQGEPFHRYYLRERVFDVYLDRVWLSSLNSENQTPDTTSEPFLTLTNRQEMIQALFHTLDTVEVRSPRTLDIANFATDGAWILKQPLWNGDTWTLYREKNPSSPPADDLEHWKQIPRQLDSRWYQLAAELKKETPQATVQAISDYLGRGFHYDKGVRVPEGRPPLDWFLFEAKRGFCVHFGSVSVLLARLENIPARYITGFALLADSQGGAMATPGLAHAWAEVYLPDQGWTVLETTPPYRSNKLPFATGDRAQAPEAPSPKTEPALSPMEQPHLENPWSWAWCLLLLPLGFGGFWAWDRLCPSEKQLWKRLIRRGRTLGIPGPETLGWTGWIRRWGQSWPRLASPRVGLLLAHRWLARRALSPRDRRHLKAWQRRVLATIGLP